jgi:hypothetical protein
VVEQRVESFASFILSGDGHGSAAAAVIGAFEGDQLAFGGASGTVSGEARQLDGTFDGFGAAVRKEGAVQAGEGAEFFGEKSLIFVVVEIRQVDGARRLIADGLHDSRVGMAERIHSQAGYEVQIFFAIDIEEKDALATFDDQRVAVVSLEQKLFLALNDFFGGGHKETSILPEKRGRMGSR